MIKNTNKYFNIKKYRGNTIISDNIYCEYYFHGNGVTFKLFNDIEITYDYEGEVFIFDEYNFEDFLENIGINVDNRIFLKDVVDERLLNNWVE